MLGDDETVNEEGEIIASEEMEQKEESTLDCGAMGMFGGVEIGGNEKIIPSTLRLEASIDGVFVVVLVDSGASHNFIFPHVVAALGLEMENEKPIGVQLGDGHKIPTLGRRKPVKIQFGNFHTVVIVEM